MGFPSLGILVAMASLSFIDKFFHFSGEGEHQAFFPAVGHYKNGGKEGASKTNPSPSRFT